MIDGAGLLEHWASLGEDDEVWDTTHVEARSELGVTLRVDLEDDRLAGHVCGDALDLWGNHAAGAAPRRPKVHEHGDAGVGGDVVEARGIDLEWFGERRQLGLAGAATTRVREVLGRDAVGDSTGGADAEHASNVSIAEAQSSTVRRSRARIAR
jgi:hypothetical protein